MYLSLIRDTATGGYCQGTLQAGALLFQTLELPWIPDPIGKGGLHGVSCVPPGLYELVRHDSAKHPHTFALLNAELDVYHLPDDVPQEKRAYARTSVLLHTANYASQLEGCCALGMTRGAGFVSQSHEAMERFSKMVPWIPGHHVGIEIADGVTP